MGTDTASSTCPSTTTEMFVEGGVKYHNHNILNIHNWIFKKITKNKKYHTVE
jgi:hypothetical protein